MTEVTLLPPPQSLVQTGGKLDISQLSIEWAEAPELAEKSPEAYRLKITGTSCTIEAGGPAGAFYAKQTLQQLRRLHGNELPCVEIEDWPDFAHRGLYHDITRGKVPTLETLKQLTDTCARYKLNQLQLYVEHTYAYEAFPEVWAGADPLTKDEVLALDAYCAERHIELVPSFTTFGHFYPFIHTKRFQHLNEFDYDVSEDAFNWFERMGHYTLDCRNPESIELVRTLIREVRPLFRSDKFNLCADETFDLGKGRNKELAEELGTGRLYLDFVTQVIEVVKDCGAIPMMWTDIVGKHPDLLPELPEGLILLDWDYSAKLGHSIAEQIEAVDRPYYVCSGTSSWNRFLCAYETAYTNITGLARRGYEHGACGHLVTDWGDYGHINPLAISYPGLCLSASVSWNVAGAHASRESHETAISKLEFGDASGRLVGLLREASTHAPRTWTKLALWQQPRGRHVPESWFDAASGLPDALVENDTLDERVAHHEALLALKPAIEACLNDARPLDTLAADELRFCLDACVLMEELAVTLLDYAGRNPNHRVVSPTAVLANKLGHFEQAFHTIWHLRNKPSEYAEIAKVLKGAARALRAMESARAR